MSNALSIRPMQRADWPAAFRHRQLGYVDALVMVQGLVEGPKR